MKGYVYAMKNPALPGLLKIGRTQKDSLARAAQLSNSSLPYCYEVVASVLSPDCCDLERRVHRYLDDYRVNECREFFKVSHDYVPEILRVQLSAQIEEMAWEYLNGANLAVTLYECTLDPSDVNYLIYDLGIGRDEVGRALSIGQADWGEDGESVIISRLRRKPEPWNADQEGAS